MKMIGTRCHAELANILREERKKAGIRQVELAKALREQQNWVTRLERGQRTVRVCELLVLAEHIGFDPIAVIKRLIEASNSPTPTLEAPVAKRRRPVSRRGRGR